MRRLLFVDDEVAILRALERMLRAHRKDWECHFQDDPARALEMLDTVAPDAVVSDMFMPGMDGADFLSDAARRRPQMARFILSGEIGAGSLARLAVAAHQSLLKPCRSDVLMDVLRHSLVEPGRLHAPALEAGLYGTHGLPLPAATVESLRDLLAQPASDARDQQVVHVIEHSAALATKLLQVASWTRHGVGTAPVDVHDAYFQLGAETLGALLDAGVLPSTAAADATVFQQDVWRRCEQVGVVAEALAEAEGFAPDARRQTILAAVWGAAAPLLLDTACRDAYAALRAEPAADGMALPDRERAAFGMSAADALAHLLRLWGLPPALSCAVARGDEAGGDTGAPGPDDLARIARAVTDVVGGGTSSAPWLADLAHTGSGPRVDRWKDAGARALDAQAA